MRLPCDLHDRLFAKRIRNGVDRRPERVTMKPPYCGQLCSYDQQHEAIERKRPVRAPYPIQNQHAERGQTQDHA